MASPTSQAGRGTAFWSGLWRISDPKITLASVASMLLGGAMAASEGPLSPGWLTLTIAAVFCLEAAKNASGEVFDFDSGTDLAVEAEDSSPFSGGKRVLVDGLMSRRQIAGVAAAFYSAGCAIGLWIATTREPSVLWLGLAGVLLAFFYHAPPLELSYRGLGELAVGVVYGPLVALGTYAVQRQELSVRLLLLAIPLGLLIAAFLWINEFPDCRADAASGKRTLVVRLGKHRASRLFGGLVALAYGLLALLPLLTSLPAGVWLGGLGLPLHLGAARRLVHRHDATREIVPAQAWTLLGFLLMSAGASIGLLLWK